MHLHTISDEIIIQTITGIYELDGTGKEYLKKNPKYCKSGSKVVVKISTRVPLCLEKYEFIEHMGRFTLRDEGKTIALGKVLRYKPAVIKKVEELPPGLAESAQAKLEENKNNFEPNATSEGAGANNDKNYEVLQYDPDEDTIVTSSAGNENTE